MSSLYLDASAITKLVLDEPETAAVQALVSGRTLISSRIAVVEVTKAAARVNPAADPQPVLALFVMVDLDVDLARIAGVTGGPELRALDAIHIAAALRVGAEVETFVTYDLHQARAAAALGLRVASPGASSQAR